MTLVAKIHKQFNKSISLREVFQYPKVEEMAKAIAEAEACGPDYIPVPKKRCLSCILRAEDGLPVNTNRRRRT